jgi:DNA-binding MarR family transcriptional regulator
LIDKNTIDRLYERKKFFRLVFNGIQKDEYIRLFQYKKGEENKEDYKHPTYWNDIDDLNNYIESHRYSANTFFSLTSTDDKGGATENLKYRYCLAWDFDKKIDSKLDSKEIMLRFSKMNLWYHILIDSGNGYHAYMCIDRTDDLNKVEEVTKAIGEKLGADPEAMLQTQILRVPITFNIKDKKKQVNIIKMYPKDTVKPYSIDKLHKKYCNTASEKTDRTIQYALDKTAFPPCIINILNGVSSGDRNFALKRLISFLKLYKYNESKSRNIILEWNYKNEPPLPDSEIKYQFDYLWEKPYNCFGCITNDTLLQSQIKTYCNKETCRNKSKEDFFFIEGEFIQVEYKICKKLEPQKKDVFQLKGNHLLVIGVLKNNPEGLSTDEIIKQLTYKDKCCLSNKTLNKILNDIADNGYVIRIKGNKRNKEKDFYKMNDIKCEEFEKFNLSYFAVLGVIKENISPEDFKIYCYMRYRLSKGLSLTQEKLADELGISQQAISLHIKKLIDEKYLELRNINYSDNVFGVNVYKVNC